MLGNVEDSLRAEKIYTESIGACFSVSDLFRKPQTAKKKFHGKKSVLLARESPSRESPPRETQYPKNGHRAAIPRAQRLCARARGSPPQPPHVVFEGPMPESQKMTASRVLHDRGRDVWSLEQVRVQLRQKRPQSPCGFAVYQQPGPRPDADHAQKRPGEFLFFRSPPSRFP